MNFETPNQPGDADHVPWYFRSLDFEQLARDYPPPPVYAKTTARISRDELRALQEQRFLSRQARRRDSVLPAPLARARDRRRATFGAWMTCEDPALRRLRFRDSIARDPPFGDFMGLSPEDGRRMPLVLQTSGGTTGLPRPMLYSPQDRETMAILGGRRFAMHGVRPGDLVLVTYRSVWPMAAWRRARRSGDTPGRCR